MQKEILNKLNNQKKMDKIYVGSGRILQTQFGILPKVAFSRKDLNKLIAYLDANDSEWVNLDMKEKKEKTEGKATHYFEVSTYLSDKPKDKNEWKPVVAKKEIIDNYEKNILPF